jgi:hypothetical protein
MRRTIALLFLAVLFLMAGTVSAQHGSAGNGYFPQGYNGDTWTGSVTSTDDTARSITLTFENKNKTETFTGVLRDTCCKVKMADGTMKDLKVSEISQGRRMIVYYVPTSVKVDGKKSTVNEIFKVDFLK